VFSGVSPYGHGGHLMEIAELPKSKHPFMLGVQFHPEFKARPLTPHPIFTSLSRQLFLKIRSANYVDAGLRSAILRPVRSDARF